MRRIFIILFLLAASFSASAQKKIAILETRSADGSVANGYLTMVSSNLETGIINNKEYMAYNRAQVATLLKEHNFQRSGMVNDEEIRQLGKMAGVDYVLASEAVLLDGRQLFVTAKVLNVETGQYDMSDNELMDYNPVAVQAGCKSLAYKLLHGGSLPQMTTPPPSTPASGNDNAEAYIAGRNVGLPQPNKNIAARGGLSAYWTFDDGTCKDITGNDMGGNIMGDVKYINETSNGYGKALQLKGPGNKDRYFFSPQLFNTDIFTVSFWAKDFSSGNLMKMFKDTYHFVNFAVDNKTFSFKIYSTNGYHECKYNFSCSASSYIASGWHHFVLSVNKGDSKLYIDGSLVDQGNANYDGHSYFEGSTKLYFGAGGPAMKLDNVRIYDRYILSSDEVKQIYESEK